MDLKPYRRVTNLDGIFFTGSVHDISSGSRNRVDIEIGVLVTSHEHIFVLQTDLHHTFLCDQVIQQAVDRICLLYRTTGIGKVSRLHVVPVRFFGYRTFHITEYLHRFQQIRVRKTKRGFERRISILHRFSVRIIAPICLPCLY